VASALGLALVIAGGVLSARSGAERTGGAETVRAVDRPDVSQPVAPPYVIEPRVRIDRAEAPRAHPARGVPTRIVVPELGVDAPVVGIDAPGGVLLPPGDPQVLGWWRSGARPGARTGSALVTGHTVSSGGGAFDDLETLRAGDRVSIRTTGGTVAYEVTGVRIYRKASLARHASRVFSQSVPGRLVLITCEDWNGTTYLSNAVVIAQPVY
jgi:LPXTG-site transpeptidase (sortase) family protein